MSHQGRGNVLLFTSPRLEQKVDHLFNVENRPGGLLNSTTQRPHEVLDHPQSREYIHYV